ncbi:MULTISPECIES: carboxymuconolactone decarboxylase family protein [Burkholderia]|nr:MULTISPECIES: carboxymuconolactone decarboxylase family protein [Burkholderia]PXX33743.1 4-carboxymuconolactone decarboxylase [Burkholderia pyrrocinia]SFW63463.1 Carboxymuconolactone decarboxylase family protein [Burkholderia sp. NFACC33-1]SFY24168.1 Carboxymuconolactone decarboxylase family protein [Burkholderia sp. NFPP32]
MGGCENQLRFQLGAALHLGIPIEQIREVFIQVQVFAGNARAFNAAAIFKSVADEFQKSE